MENDRSVMFKRPVPLEFTSSGHYCVDIRDKDPERNRAEDEVVLVTENMSLGEKRKVLLKLHKQFGSFRAQEIRTKIA